MKVVVVGASGNVGSSLLDRLSSESVVREVVAVSRRLPAGRFPKTTWVKSDISADDISEHLRGADALVHLAWLIQPSRDIAYCRMTNVDGTRRLLDAAAQTEVPAVIYASSVGAYSAGPKDEAVDESWPTDGVPTSYYSVHKAETERMLDLFEADHPQVRVVRLRPGLIFKRSAASEIRRYFLGPLFPNLALWPRFVPVVPSIERLRFQAVHTEDAARAYVRAILGEVRGPFNIAAEPVLEPPTLARSLHSLRVPVPARAVRAAAAASYRMRLHPTTPDWLDMALQVPVMDCTRAHEVLDWFPERSSIDALTELLAGLRRGSGDPRFPPLVPDRWGMRLREIAGGGPGARAA